MSGLLQVDFSAPKPKAALESPTAQSPVLTGLAGYIRKCFEECKDHREREGLHLRMLDAMRAMRGEYDAQTLQDIRNFGGSELYARITAGKVRGVSALLREIYTAAERPWALSPTPEPDLSGPTMDQAVDELLRAELLEAAAQLGGVQPDEQMVAARKQELRRIVLEQRRHAAETALRVRELRIDDLLWEGGFYDALWEFLMDIATFPFACLKGPVVEYRNNIRWEGGKPVVKREPTMLWRRCSPFDVFFAPWSRNVQEGFVIHRQRIGRQNLRNLDGLPSYSSAAIQRVLAQPATTGQTWFDFVEFDRAHLEQRNDDRDPIFAADHPYPMLEFHGPVRGKDLLDWGMEAEKVSDENADYDIVAYVVADEVIGVRLNPHPAGHKPFYVDSFERVPGSIYGHGVPDLIEDIQGVCNATLRALVNNMAIASGPMGYVNEDRMGSESFDGKLFPWKMFRVTDSLDGSSSSSVPPVSFFQPDSNAQVLIGVFEKFAQMADELSSLPRYMQGNAQGVGGAGRTASGLSMLIEASNRTIKQTVASIDANIIEPVVQNLNIYLALMRPDIVTDGDLSVVARGAVELVQRETLRMRRIEFLNVTGSNPMDMQLVGPKGRLTLLREVARDLGLPLDAVVPNPADMPAQPPGPPQGDPAAQGTPPAPGQEPPPAAGVARPMSNNPGA